MSARIEKIKETYSAQLKERLKRGKIDISLDSAWDILISADPTKNKKNVRWLIESYLNDGYLWEDIASGVTSKVCETLTEFDKHKRNLEPSERSLMKYETLGSLWSEIKPYVGQLTPGEEKKSERDKAYAEADIILDRKDGLKIICPKTEYAAKWFGRGTRWCTAADNNNMFAYYASRSNLYIGIHPDGRKFQVWKHTGPVDEDDYIYPDESQFMDEDDNEVKISDLSREDAKILLPFLLYTSLDYDKWKDKFNNGEDNREALICILKSNQYNIGDYRHELTNEDYEKIIDSNNVEMRYLPHDWYISKDHYSDKFYDIAFNRKHENLWDFPEEQMTRDRIMLLVSETPHAIFSVPDKCLDMEMIQNSIKKEPEGIALLPELKIYKKNKEQMSGILKDILDDDPSYIKYFTKDILEDFPELLVMAIQNSDDLCKNVLPVFLTLNDISVDTYKMALEKESDAVFYLGGWNKILLNIDIEKDIQNARKSFHNISAIRDMAQARHIITPEWITKELESYGIHVPENLPFDFLENHKMISFDRMDTAILKHLDPKSQIKYMELRLHHNPHVLENIDSSVFNDIAHKESFQDMLISCIRDKGGAGVIRYIPEGFINDEMVRLVAQDKSVDKDLLPASLVSIHNMDIEMNHEYIKQSLTDADTLMNIPEIKPGLTYF